MAAAAIIAAAATAVSVYGTLKSASDQSDIENRKASLGRVQANEVLEREQSNDANMRMSVARAKLQFGSSFAATGREGAGIGSQLELQRQTDAQISLNDKEAQFQAYMLTQGADLQSLSAQDTKSAGYWQSAGSLLGGASQVYSYSANRPNSSKSQGYT